ncbi:hypothetical protein A2997_00780 [Candidatus Nomurabacteria bacterium RIFCSPLOWO2_01_FULL_36_10b]|uniref:Response regulatory domain-containing protein n=1 Tax=Candidatus Nomurabacteria bacterium RIFCSPLOWO2_01_FULL_36_10b TaxID=1801766 RepID=A0A1F6WQ77_9BACT|nr:MAG: hypothetical protein A2997_00780 [Candidatus Nomurabacteria bacterium RIFCSPLOWO2_01_FULL_36_10b]
MTTSGKNILIIEDDEFLLSLAVTKLQKAGYDVESAKDGEDGIKKLAETKPDLLILDLMLPHIDGFEILKQIKSDTKFAGMRIVVFSNLGSDEDISKATKLGANDYMVKSSFTLDELVAKIDEHLK